MATNTSVTTTARNKQDVDNMSAADRLWDSLNYSYGQKREDSDKAFNKAIFQQNRSLLSKGMGRSSFAAQTEANLRQQQIDARNAIYDQQIADYENRKSDLEQQEWNKAFQEKSFNENVRQFDLNFGYQKERDAISDQQFAQKFAEEVRMNNQNSATNYAMTMLQNGQMPSDDMLAAAGLSKADAERLLSGFNAAKAGSSSGGSGGRGGNPGSNNNPPPPGDQINDQDLYNSLALGRMHTDSSPVSLNDFLGSTTSKQPTKTPPKNGATALLEATDKTIKSASTTANKSGTVGKNRIDLLK